MAKSKPDKRNQKTQEIEATASELSPALAQPLLEQATDFFQTGQPDEALPVARKSLRCLAFPDVPQQTKLPVLELIGEIQIELGIVDEARRTFEEAARLDPDAALPEEEGGGADKFLWLAQLSEDGGADSIKWFEKGMTVLRRELDGDIDSEDEDGMMLADEKKTKLANALCGAAEVYMTDLSWEEDAEQRCEAFVTEACLVAPDSPEPLQTLASVRLSQGRLDDARAALHRSLDLWSSLPPEHVDVPEFPTRISLARLLMEAEMEEKAIEVLERLVAEDDNSVEAWYLGGWCLNLLGTKRATTNSGAMNGIEEAAVAPTEDLMNSRKWLQESLRLYTTLDYEDDRLHEHAQELVKGLDGQLGPASAEKEGDEDDWQDDEGDEADDDTEMI